MTGRTNVEYITHLTSTFARFPAVAPRHERPLARALKGIVDVPARAEQIDYPAPHAIRWLLVPVVGWAVFSTVARILRERARNPTIAPMSDEWLRAHETTSGRGSEY